MATKNQRDSAKRRMRELQELVNEWDPAGLLAIGAPKDEYDCLVGPILSRLARSATAPELAEWVTSHVADHFGVRPANPHRFVQKVVAWYRGGSQGRDASSTAG
jgi:hypothetical protein